MTDMVFFGISGEAAQLTDPIQEEVMSFNVRAMPL